MRTILKTVLSFLLLFFNLFALHSSAQAQGDLMIYPKRLVFNGSGSEVIALVNDGKDTATYNISFIQMRLNENGSVTQISQPDPEQRFADKNLRVYPRTVTLAPKEVQNLKIQAFQTESLQPGEYRSHLYLRSVPKERVDTTGQNDPQADTTFSVKLRPVYGFSIPIIIRKGADSTKITMDEVVVGKRNDTTYFVRCTLHRTGNMSAYGGITVNYTDDLGKTTEVGIIKGVAVYTPNTKRTVEFNLDPSKPYTYQTGKLTLKYVDETGARPIEWASATLDIKANSTTAR